MQQQQHAEGVEVQTISHYIKYYCFVCSYLSSFGELAKLV